MTIHSFKHNLSHMPQISLILLFTGGVFLGVAPVVVKAIEFTPEVSAFYRVALSVPIFILSAFLFSAPRTEFSSRGSRLSTIILCLVTALFFAADLVVMHMAIRYTDVAVATLLTNCAPFFVGIMGLIGLSDPPNRSFWIMLPIALLGSLLLMGATTGEDSQFFGNVLSLLAACLYGAYVICVSKLRKRGVGTSTIMVVVTLISTALIFPLFVANGFPIPTNFKTVALLAALVIIGQIFGQGLVTSGLKGLAPSFSSLVLLIQPVVAGLLSWWFLSEVLSPLQILGIVLVLGAIAGAKFISDDKWVKNKNGA